MLGDKFCVICTTAVRLYVIVVKRQRISKHSAHECLTHTLSNIPVKHNIVDSGCLAIQCLPYSIHTKERKWIDQVHCVPGGRRSPYLLLDIINAFSRHDG